MKSNLCIPFLCLVSGAFAAGAPDAVRMLATAPLRFEPAPEGRSSAFIARGDRFHFEFTRYEALLQEGGKNLRLQFAGASRQARMEAVEPLVSKTNSYLGNDPTRWRTAIPNYGRLQVDGLYRGIDLVYYGNAGQLEYDLTLQPGADPSQIRLRLKGDRATLDRDGNLIAQLIQKHPIAYQSGADGARIPVDSRYRVNADGSYGFALGHYDPARELVIDPVLTLDQYLGGTHQDVGYGIGHDAQGLIYVAGTTNSTDVTLTGSSLQKAPGGSADLFLAIINPAAKGGPQVTYVTYLGGSGADLFGSMAVGPKGDVYLTGSTQSGNFPTKNAFKTAIAGSAGAPDAFVVWLDHTQALAYGSLLGGGAIDAGTGIAADSKGRIWIAGNTQSTDFPASGGFQSALIGTQNMFIAGFDPSQSGAASLIYAIYIGGTHWDVAHGIAVAADGTLWLAAGTYSPDIWIVGRSYQPTSTGAGAGYLAHLNPGLGAKALVYSTFLGGSDMNEATSIVLDPAGRVIVSGFTLSTDFPVTADAYQPQYGGNADAFVSILNPSASGDRSAQLVYSTYFGGSDADAPFDLKLDSKGILYLTGYTLSPDLQTTSNAAQPAWDGSLDVFALKLDPSQPGAAGLDYCTYLGSDGLQVGYGVDFDSKGNIYVTGYSSGPIFAALGGVGKSTSPGNVDAFVIGLNTAPR
jgi:hypothetical protein